MNGPLFLFGKSRNHFATIATTVNSKASPFIAGNQIDQDIILSTGIGVMPVKIPVNAITFATGGGNSGIWRVSNSPGFVSQMLHPICVIHISFSLNCPNQIMHTDFFTFLNDILYKFKTI